MINSGWTTNSWEKIVPTLTPSLTFPNQPIFDTTSVTLASACIERDGKNAMKCIYGSHKATIMFFMPIQPLHSCCEQLKPIAH